LKRPDPNFARASGALRVHTASVRVVEAAPHEKKSAVLLKEGLYHSQRLELISCQEFGNVPFRELTAPL
jgi:hypothetical protein